MLMFAYCHKQKPGVQIKPHLGNQLRLQSTHGTLKKPLPSKSRPPPRAAQVTPSVKAFLQPCGWTARLNTSPWHGCCPPNPSSWFCLGSDRLTPQQNNTSVACWWVLSSAQSRTGILVFEGDVLHGTTQLCLVIWHRLQEKNHRALHTEMPQHYISPHTHMQTHPGKKQRMLEPALTLQKAVLVLSQKKWAKIIDQGLQTPYQEPIY